MAAEIEVLIKNDFIIQIVNSVPNINDGSYNQLLQYGDKLSSCKLIDYVKFPLEECAVLEELHFLNKMTNEAASYWNLHITNKTPIKNLLISSVSRNTSGQVEIYSIIKYKLPDNFIAQFKNRDDFYKRCLHIYFRNYPVLVNFNGYCTIYQPCYDLLYTRNPELSFYSSHKTGFNILLGDAIYMYPSLFLSSYQNIINLKIYNFTKPLSDVCTELNMTSYTSFVESANKYLTEKNDTVEDIIVSYRASKSIVPWKINNEEWMPKSYLDLWKKLGWGTYIIIKNILYLIVLYSIIFTLSSIISTFLPVNYLTLGYLKM